MIKVDIFSGFLGAGKTTLIKKLLEEGVPVGAQSMQAIGYKELIPCILGNYPEEAAAEEIRKRSRHYAKRQLTWFRRDEYIKWIYVDQCDDVYEKAQKILEKTESVLQKKPSSLCDLAEIYILQKE